jgi:hypothetical protein
MRGPAKVLTGPRVFKSRFLVSEHCVEIDHQVSSRLIHDCIAIHVASRVSHRDRRQASLHFIREGLDPSIPFPRKFSGPIVFLRKSGRQLALVIISANCTQMLFTEALVAVAAMAIPIIVIFPMLPPMVVVMILSLHGLRRQG